METGKNTRTTNYYGLFTPQKAFAQWQHWDSTGKRSSTTPTVGQPHANNGEPNVDFITWSACQLNRSGSGWREFHASGWIVRPGKKAWGKTWRRLRWKIPPMFPDDNGVWQMRRIKIAAWPSVDSKNSHLLHQLRVLCVFECVWVLVPGFQLQLTSVESLNLTSTRRRRHTISLFSNGKPSLFSLVEVCLTNIVWAGHCRAHTWKNVTQQLEQRCREFVNVAKIMLDTTLNLQGSGFWLRWFSVHK